MPQERAKRSRPPNGPLAVALRACRRHFAWTLAFSALVNLLYLAPTLYMLQVYDRVVATGGLATLAFVTLALILALVSMSLIDGMRTRLLVRAGLRLDRLLAGEVLGRLMSGRAATGPRITQAMREFDLVRQTLTGPATLALCDAPWTPLYLICAFVLHPFLGLLILVGGATLFALAVANERAVKTRSERVAVAQAQTYLSQEAAAAQAEVVRALGMRRALVARHLKARQEATVLAAQTQFAGGRYSGAIKFLRTALQSLALGLGAWLAVERQISAGAIIAGSVLLSRALQPIEQLVGVWSGVVQARSSWSTLEQLFEQELDGERTRLPTPRGQVQVENLAVRHPGGEGLVLRGVSFALAAGELCGLVGPSGSGKTTLARTLVGAIEPDLGSVRLDGAELRAWDSERLARHIGYLPQESVLFAGTVRDNIARFEGETGAVREEVDAKVVAAAMAAGAHELVLRLPHGYDTPLGPRGQGLSAGQAQRVALARALYGEPQFVVLDEPNANLDADGEAALVRAILGVKARGATGLVIAHRTGVLSAVDRLGVLGPQGELELFGPREEVLARLNEREARRPGRAAPTVVRGSKPA